jgi:hypothetical protein
MHLRMLMIGSLVMTGACVDPLALEEREQMLSANGQRGLDWANGWIGDAKLHPEQVAENLYTTTSPALVRLAAGVMATNRTVCGTFITRLFQNSVGYTSSDFYNSFDKSTLDCQVGTVGGDQKGTTSPDAAQYQWKIASCASVGPIKFTPRTTIAAVEAGDVLAMKYTDPAQHNNATGHVMIVRSVPVVDASLKPGPQGSTGYTVEVIDSTSTSHGATDWRALNAGQGLGYGTFVLYADSAGAIVASRWSPSDSSYNDTTIHPLAIGGLQ